MAEEVTPRTADLINLTLESPDVGNEQSNNSPRKAGPIQPVSGRPPVEKSIDKKKRK